MNDEEIKLMRSIQAIDIATESLKRFFKTLLGYAIGRLLLIPVMALVYGIPFWYLWNHIMLAFGLPRLSYLHASGLLVILSWVFPSVYIPITQQIDKSENPKWLNELLRKTRTY